MGPLKEWAVMGFSVIAFILLVKLGASYLPDTGIFGALKRVLTSV